MTNDRARPDADRVRELFQYDAAEGALTWRIFRGGKLPGERAGSLKSNGYRYVSVDRTKYGEHRVIWLYVHGVWPIGDVDHIDGDCGNNRIANLRDVPKQMNMQNLRRAHKDSISGFLGVGKQKYDSGRPWVANIMVAGKQTHLGSFSTPEEAHACYLRAKRELHPGNTL